MTAYKNTDEKSIFASAEFDDKTNTGFFFIKNEVDIENAKQLLTAAGQTIITQSYIKGHTVIVSKGPDTRETLFRKLAGSDGDRFEPVKPEKMTLLKFLRTHGWKLRGGSSVVGQSLTLFSAFKTVSRENAEAGKLTPKFDPATGAFATLNLAANFINYIFGGQKEDDEHGLKKFDGIIAEEVNRYLPEGAQKVSSDDVRKLAYMNEKERAEHEKSGGATGIMRKNSVRLGEVGLRTLGSIFLMIDYKRLGKGLAELKKGNLWKAFMEARAQDTGTFIAGCGMVAGKMMGLFAQTYDPNNPPKSYIGEIRQKVLWIASSFTEMIAQSSLVYDRLKNKRLVFGGKAYRDYTGAVGNVLLTVPPYPTRLVLPYGEKVLDAAEVQARLLNELPKLPPDKIAGVAARVTARMVEHMGDKSPPFSQLYSNILNKLDAFHDIKLPSSPASTPAPVVEPAPAKNFSASEKRETVKNLLNKDAAKTSEPAAVSF